MNKTLVVMPMYHSVYGKTVMNQEVVEECVEMIEGEVYVLDGEYKDDTLLFVPLKRHLHDGAFFQLETKEYIDHPFIVLTDLVKNVGEETL